MISQRTKDALAAAKANGKQLGGLRDHGRELQQAAVERAKALEPLFNELTGKSAREIARILNAQRVYADGEAVVRDDGHSCPRSGTAGCVGCLTRSTLLYMAAAS